MSSDPNKNIKIVLTNWINFVGILIIWGVEVFINLDFRNISFQSFTIFFSSGISSLILLLFILMICEYIFLNLNRDFKYNWMVILIQCIVLSSPFVYWIIKNNNRDINLAFIIMIITTQYFRKKILIKL
jgi:hypothetical protein